MSFLLGQFLAASTFALLNLRGPGLRAMTGDEGCSCLQAASGMGSEQQVGLQSSTWEPAVL